MTEQAGYYGKRRKWHSWGYEDEVISQAEVKEMAVRKAALDQMRTKAKGRTDLLNVRNKALVNSKE